MNTYAFGLIDTQRGFMPKEEGERLGLEGFGELGVTDGELIIPKVNALLDAFAIRFTTQDWHPRETAHFSDHPNYETTWPVHCVGGTPGAELHPDIHIPVDTYQFLKGNESLKDGAEDTSYTGYNGYSDSLYSASDFDWLRLPEFLANRRVDMLVLGGLALDYCVKATALDFKQKMGLDVVVVTDATKPVAQETGAAAIEEMTAAGIRFATTEEVLRIAA